MNVFDMKNEVRKQIIQIDKSPIKTNYSIQIENQFDQGVSRKYDKADGLYVFQLMDSCILTYEGKFSVLMGNQNLRHWGDFIFYQETSRKKMMRIPI